jgi:chromosome segregation ATPase
MTVDEPAITLRDEIEMVEQELEELRQTVADLRRRIGERWDSPTDPEERGSLITYLEEQKAVLRFLEARRDELRRRLGAG